MIQKPAVDEERYLHVWEQQVLVLKDAYRMHA